uniref:Uncharacterized protein n=1 Tax=Heterodera glycines TaxID=51029 RepID=Q5I5I7_HETGL|nr:unknown [Heterodera glycines]
MSPLRFFVALFLITLAILAGTHGTVENSVDGGPNMASPIIRERRWGHGGGGHWG